METRYERRTISLILPDHQHLLDYLDQLVREHRDTTGAVRFLIEYHQKVAPLAGSTPEVAEVINELRHNSKVVADDLIKAIATEAPELLEVLRQSIEQDV